MSTAMTSDQLAQHQRDRDAGRWEVNPTAACAAAIALLAEIERMRACKHCDGARVIQNQGGIMVPVHNWTGPVKDPSKGEGVIHNGDAYSCPCTRIAHSQA